MAGHGISASSTYCGKYRATEYGVMMGIMSIMPRSMYQQGINRQWMRKTKYDYYFPEFANLSEQAVKIMSFTFLVIILLMTLYLAIRAVMMRCAQNKI